MKEGNLNYVVWLNQPAEKSLLGGKGAALNELTTKSQVPIPPGFVVTTKAFSKFMEVNGLGDKVKHLINELIRNKTPEEYEEASKAIRALIEDADVPIDVANEIINAYKELEKLTGTKNVAVAVRSSASAEDLKNASFAGEQETYLNVKGEESLITYIKKVWSSLYTARAIMYRDEKGVPHDNVSMAVVVQKMVNAKSAGVMFTLNPLNGDRTKVVIESAWGLGEGVASGIVTPDRWVVDKGTLSIVERVINRKTRAIVMDEKGLTKTIELSNEKAESPSLADEEVLTLAKIAINLENYYGYPLDIEWAVDVDLNFPNNILILQVRPETVWSTGKASMQMAEVKHEGKVVVKGIPASPGIAIGKAKVCLTVEEASKKLSKGDILVTKMTNPDWVPYMKIASAIITDEGGLTSHAAIVSRELGIPAIVGAGNATTTILNDSVYTVDATRGLVYEGVITTVSEGSKTTVEVTKQAQAFNDIILHIYRSIRTATGVYMNLGVPEKIDEYKDLPFDGIGLMRIEFVISSYVNDHPLYLLKIGNEGKFVDKLAEGIAYVAKAIYPRPVIVRFSDFKSNEYRQLKGGEEFEPEERNPMLGWRGVSRYISKDYEKAFRLEVRAIKKVREEMGLKNVYVMAPFVRAPWEMEKFIEILNDEGLRRNRDFKVYAMAEIPSIVFLVDEFSKYVDGFSIGSNDLTQLILGTDRDNDVLVRQDARYFDEREPSVLKAMYELIRKAHAHGRTVGICGQAPSVYPEITEFLIRAGIDYVSVNPDAVIQTRLLVDSIERKILLENLRWLRSKLDPRDPDVEFEDIIRKVFGGFNY